MKKKDGLEEAEALQNEYDTHGKEYAREIADRIASSDKQTAGDRVKIVERAQFFVQLRMSPTRVAELIGLKAPNAWQRYFVTAEAVTQGFLSMADVRADGISELARRASRYVAAAKLGVPVAEFIRTTPGGVDAVLARIAAVVGDRRRTRAERPERVLRRLAKIVMHLRAMEDLGYNAFAVVRCAHEENLTTLFPALLTKGRGRKV